VINGKVNVVYIYTTVDYLVVKKNEIISSAGKVMKLEIIMLSKINQAEKDKYQMLFPKCRI
jgi:hypothetical protein